jgi:hypothetical protein
VARSVHCAPTAGNIAQYEADLADPAGVYADPVRSAVTRRWMLSC